MIAQAQIGIALRKRRHGQRLRSKSELHHLRSGGATWNPPGLDPSPYSLNTDRASTAPPNNEFASSIQREERSPDRSSHALSPEG
jgi:hypothetical protein